MKNFYTFMLIALLTIVLSGCSADKNIAGKNKVKATSQIITVQNEPNEESGNERISIEKARELLGIKDEHELIDITSNEIWEKTNYQVFKILDAASPETFVIKGTDVFPIGRQLGGFGVTSIIPYDVNQDGEVDLVYAFSWNSGIHHSEIAWFNSADKKEYAVSNEIDHNILRTYDILLAEEDGEIFIYEIDESSNLDSLGSYPFEGDIEEMLLLKEGKLYYKDNQLYERRLASFIGSSDNFEGEWKRTNVESALRGTVNISNQTTQGFDFIWDFRYFFEGMLEGRAEFIDKNIAQGNAVPLGGTKKNEADLLFFLQDDKLIVFNRNEALFSDIGMIVDGEYTRGEPVYINENPSAGVNIQNQDENRKKEYKTVTVKKQINPSLPEFRFEITGFLNKENPEDLDLYAVESIRVFTPDNKLLQEIQIPNLTIWGNTQTPADETMGFALEDLNFDGYLDIRLYDAMNGNYKAEYLYFVWDNASQNFKIDRRFNELSLPVFDQEKKLIYTTERGSAADHYYGTYQYIGGNLVLIETYSEEYVRRPLEEIMAYFKSAGIDTDIGDTVAFHETVHRRNEKTGEMELVRDEFVFYRMGADTLRAEDIVIRIAADSAMGRRIAD